MRPRPVRTGVAVAAILAISGVLSGCGATAQDRTEFVVEPTVALAPLDPAQLEDLTFFAHQEGVPVEEMVARFQGSDVFGDAIGTISRRSGTAFVTGEWRPEGADSLPFVVFNIDPAQEDLDTLATVGVPILVVVSALPNSRYRDNVVVEVAGAIVSDWSFGVGANWETSTILVDVGVPKGAEIVQVTCPEGLTWDTALCVPVAPPGFVIEVRVSDVSPSPEE